MLYEVITVLFVFRLIRRVSHQHAQLVVQAVSQLKLALVVVHLNVVCLLVLSQAGVVAIDDEVIQRLGWVHSQAAPVIHSLQSILVRAEIRV